MNERWTWNENLGSVIVQGPPCELYATLKDLWRFRLKVIVNRVPQHPYPIRYRQSRIVKLNLHIEDVRHTGACHLRHVLSVPNPAPDRNSVGNPSHVHRSFILRVSRSMLLLSPVRFPVLR